MRSQTPADPWVLLSSPLGLLVEFQAGNSEAQDVPQRTRWTFFLHHENVLKDVLVLSESPQIYFISPILELCKSPHPDAAQ